MIGKCSYNVDEYLRDIVSLYNIPIMFALFHIHIYLHSIIVTDFHDFVLLT